MQPSVRRGTRMFTEYIDAAMQHAVYEWLEEDGLWYAEIPPLQGVWAAAPTREELPAELRSVLEGWIELGLQFGDPIPEIDGVSVTPKPVR
jgi:predicted RNase H-like HicB family nuclease